MATALRLCPELVAILGGDLIRGYIIIIIIIIINEND